MQLDEQSVDMWLKLFIWGAWWARSYRRSGLFLNNRLIWEKKCHDVKHRQNIGSFTHIKKHQVVEIELLPVNLLLYLWSFFTVNGPVAWQCSECSRMSWRSPEEPLSSSAGHINPAGLCLYGSPAHTSVMRVNKQRGKGQLSPQNKRGHKGGKKRWEERRAAWGGAQITVSVSSREWCTRQQPWTGNDYKQRTEGGVYKRKELHCLYLSNLLLPRIRWQQQDL